MSNRDIELLDELIEDAEQIGLENVTAFTRFQRRGEMLLKHIFGDNNEFASELAGLYFGATYANPSQEEEYEERQLVLDSARDLLEIAREKIELSTDELAEEDENNEDVEPEEIFIVHGHDDALKEAVARVIGQLGYEPIILHEQPNSGRTIIEKFDEEADVDFAVVLLSPDDLARGKNEQTERPRARQNVIFELGYFLGRIGRENVACIYRFAAGFEIPSDYSGVTYTEFDKKGAWKYELARELANAGFEIDMNDLG